MPERSCVFSRCRTFRYRLDILWGEGPSLNWLMLNPSTADEIANDPTIERCEQRARAWGYGRLIVTNLFAFRATDPRQLRAAIDPIGPQNNRHIARAAREADLVVAAWGNHGRFGSRSTAVIRMLDGRDVRLYALNIAKTGEPMHPLYLPYRLRPKAYRTR